MQRNPFDPEFEGLPSTLPIFPLTGVLLLPRGRLPLNVFEPRYLAMTFDVLGEGRMIGMIQPVQPGRPGMNPPVYPIGCAGRITSFAETDDGRVLLTLTGVIRFEIQHELPVQRGYRRVLPDYGRFRDDLEEIAAAACPTPGVRRERLLKAVRAYFAAQGMTANWDVIMSTPDDRLITSLAMVCPFEPEEKQALLASQTLGDRAEMIITLMEMAAHAGSTDGGDTARH